MPAAPARPSQSAHSRPLAPSGTSMQRGTARAARPTSPANATSAERAIGTAGTRCVAVTIASSTPAAATKASRMSIAASDSQAGHVARPVPGQEQRGQQRHAGRRRHHFAGAQPSQIHRARSVSPLRPAWIRRRRPRLLRECRERTGRMRQGRRGGSRGPPAARTLFAGDPLGRYVRAARRLPPDARPDQWGLPASGGTVNRTFSSGAAAARSVFTSSIARVIGPTPPGTGVIAPRPLARGLEVHVADQAGVGAVGAHVDHDGSLAAPCRRSPGPASRPRRSARPPRGRPRRGRACASGSA